MLKKLHKSLTLLKKEAKSKKCKTALVVTVTTQSLDKYPKIFPLRHMENYVCLPIGIKNDVSGRKLAEYFDGKVDVIFVDSENKLPTCTNLSRKIINAVCRSKVYIIKGNDFSADAAFSLVCTVMKSIVAKKICVIGAGNIGSKVALKFIECGARVFILNATEKSTVQTANAINMIKPKGCKNRIVAITNGKIPKNLDCVIGFTRGIPVITKEIVSLVKNNGLILDGGSGTISYDGIEEAKKRKLNVLRLDIRMGFISFASLMLNTEKLMTNIAGMRKIHRVKIVAGGYIGTKGDVVVDNIKEPKEVLGVSDGKGSFLSDYTLYKDNVVKISEMIENSK